MYFSNKPIFSRTHLFFKRTDLSRRYIGPYIKRYFRKMQIKLDLTILL